MTQESKTPVEQVEQPSKKMRDLDRSEFLQEMGPGAVAAVLDRILRLFGLDGAVVALLLFLDAIRFVEAKVEKPEEEKPKMTRKEFFDLFIRNPVQDPVQALRNLTEDGDFPWPRYLNYMLIRQALACEDTDNMDVPVEFETDDISWMEGGIGPSLVLKEEGSELTTGSHFDNTLLIAAKRIRAMNASVKDSDDPKTRHELGLGLLSEEAAQKFFGENPEFIHQLGFDFKALFRLYHQEGGEDSERFFPFLKVWDAYAQGLQVLAEEKSKHKDFYQKQSSFYYARLLGFIFSRKLDNLTKQQSVLIGEILARGSEAIGAQIQTEKGLQYFLNKLTEFQTRVVNPQQDRAAMSIRAQLILNEAIESIRDEVAQMVVTKPFSDDVGFLEAFALLATLPFKFDQRREDLLSRKIPHHQELAEEAQKRSAQKILNLWGVEDDVGLTEEARRLNRKIEKIWGVEAGLDSEDLKRLTERLYFTQDRLEQEDLKATIYQMIYDHLTAYHADRFPRVDPVAHVQALAGLKGTKFLRSHFTREEIRFIQDKPREAVEWIQTEYNIDLGEILRIHQIQKTSEWIAALALKNCRYTSDQPRVARPGFNLNEVPYAANMGFFRIDPKHEGLSNLRFSLYERNEGEFIPNGMPTLFPTLFKEQVFTNPNLKGFKLVSYKSSEGNRSMIGVVPAKDWDDFQNSGIEYELVESLNFGFRRYGEANKNGEFDQTKPRAGDNVYMSLGEAGKNVKLPLNEAEDDYLGNIVCFTNFEDQDGNLNLGAVLKKGDGEFILAPAGTRSSHYYTGEFKEADPGRVYFCGRHNSKSKSIRAKMINLPSGLYDQGLRRAEELVKDLLRTFDPNASLPPRVADLYSRTATNPALGNVGAVYPVENSWNPMDEVNQPPEISLAIGVISNGKLIRRIPCGSARSLLPIIGERGKDVLIEDEEGNSWITVAGSRLSGTDVLSANLGEGRIDKAVDGMLLWLAEKFPDLFQTGSHTSIALVVPHQDYVDHPVALKPTREGLKKFVQDYGWGMLLAGAETAASFGLSSIPPFNFLVGLGIPPEIVTYPLLLKALKDYTEVRGGL